MKVKTWIASVALVVLGTAVAAAADLPVRAEPPPPPLPVPVFGWTGFYIGANIGGAWANNNWTDTLFLTNFNNSNNGVFIGGGQVGVNYQIGNYVVGAEWDFDGVAKHNGTGVAIPAVGSIVITDNNRWITTVAARFGYAFDHWLFYGKAGGGWVGAHNNLTITNVTTGVSLSCDVINCNASNGGWLVGAGAEWEFAPNWSVKFEYDYLGLGSRTFVIPAAAPLLAGDTFTDTNNRNVQQFKIGVNYLFNWGRRAAGYY